MPHTKKHTPRSVTPLDLLLAENIKTRRIALGFTQEQMADDLGISFQQIQKYEKAMNRISAVRLSQIAIILDCPIAELFKGFPSMPKNENDSLLTQEAAEFFHIFSLIENEDHKRRAKKVLKAFLN